MRSNYSNFNQVLKDIRSLKIQGAQNIAIAAVKTLSQKAKKSKALIKTSFLHELKKSKALLEATRPTEPAMRNALSYIVNNVPNTNQKNSKQTKILQLKKQITDNAEYALNHLQSTRKLIAHHGQKLIKQQTKHKKSTKPFIIYTHCHSSTVTSIIKEAHFQGKNILVHNTETRPRLQGRKTAKELANYKIPVKHYVDSGAKLAMENADLILFGMDAITDKYLYNKIGTEMFCEIATKRKIPIYFCTDSWKYDPKPHFGKHEKIEQRNPKEVWQNAPKSIKIFNPAFEEIPVKYATGIISELGIFSHKKFIKQTKKTYPILF
jgi:ribose 1,5-bisphosphate isomerase